MRETDRHERTLMNPIGLWDQGFILFGRELSIC